MKNSDSPYRASNEDLHMLCDIVVKDKDGNFRVTESLSGTYIFKKNYPHDIKGMLQPLVEEFKEFGGNSFANFFRGGGPEYAEILRDVAKRNKVNFNRKSTDEQVEQYLLQKLFNDSLINASDEDLKKNDDGTRIPYHKLFSSGCNFHIDDRMESWRVPMLHPFGLRSQRGNEISCR